MIRGQISVAKHPKAPIFSPLRLCALREPCLYCSENGPTLSIIPKIPPPGWPIYLRVALLRIPLSSLWLSRVIRNPTKLARLAAAGGMLWLVLSGCACCSRPCGFWDRWPDEGNSPDAACKPGASAGGPTLPDGYYNHPRFHPVPTQPVFTPRIEPLVTSQPELPSGPENVPPGVPNRLPPAIVPEPIPAPAPLPPVPSSNTSGPPSGRVAASSADAGSWLFSPATQQSASRHKEPSVELTSDSSAVDQRTLR